MTKEEIAKLIREHVWADYDGNLQDVDNVSKIIADIFDNMPTGGGIENWADYMDHVERNLR